jgi:hypothetical protein
VNVVAALDLGSVRDYSALAITEHLTTAAYAPGGPTPCRHDLVHLERFALGTSYAAIVESVARRIEPLGAETRLVYDATGLGSAVGQVLADAYRNGLYALRPWGITITGGQAPGPGSVPKVDLIAALQADVETGRLHIADGLPLADVLTAEMLAFRPKLTTVRRLLTFGAATESAHDDVVLAVALSVWHHGRRSRSRYVGRDGVTYERRELCAEPY